MKYSILSVLVGSLLLVGCGGGGSNTEGRIDGAVWKTSGKIVDEKGSPIANADISVRLGKVTYATKSHDDGTYNLETPKEYNYPSTFAGIIKKDGYMPSTLLFSYSNGALAKDVNSANPKLPLIRESDVIFFQGLDIIHLGDDSFQGSSNSQLQVPSQGKVWLDTFKFTSNLKNKYDQICINMTARGINSQGNQGQPSNDNISLSEDGKVGTYIVQILKDSDISGAFTNISHCFSLSTFALNKNSDSTIRLQINSQPASGDYDDFEMINVVGTLSNSNGVTQPTTSPNTEMNTFGTQNQNYFITVSAPLSSYPIPQNGGFNISMSCASAYADFGQNFEYVRPSDQVVVSGETIKSAACRRVNSDWPNVLNKIDKLVSTCGSKPYDNIGIVATNSMNNYSTNYSASNPIEWGKLQNQAFKNYQADVDLCKK
ncbi:hypothetical protein F895_03167 [Acinetobacter sp. CIP 64.2]|uniref:carboxypeptidase-like regulatory domain-containing protein n=2 Tax=Moraxellaceae TaxID=468 RepID=UPI000288D34F|nr:MULTISPECIES: carboxypeptidase-like regulatory domain-containing protein [Acinetobacter]ENX12240.1 hypothetical protein F895_03167 [Acinetobacter sp. CIP 64.2]